jgi:cardiolipin synthase
MNMWLTWANAVTATRIAAAPVIGYCMAYEQWGMVLLLAACAVITDFCDGMIARALHQETVVGAILDHAADKLLMITMLSMLIIKQVPEIPQWFCWVVLSKEIVLLVGAALFFVTGWVITIAPLKIGKIAMAVQMIVLVWLLAAKLFVWSLPIAVFGLVVGLELVVLVAYIAQVGVFIEV